MAQKRNAEIPRTTLLNLPTLVWDKITRQFLIHPQNELRNLCLASSVLDSMVTQDLRQNKWMLLGVQVLPLLTENLYLKRNDLENLIETKSDYLGKLAAMSWIFLFQPNFESVDLNNEEMVRKLEENVETKNKENRIWAAFAGKQYLFVSHKIGSMKQFLEKYGKYLLFVDVKVHEEMHPEFEATGFIESGILPNLQIMFVEKESDGTVYINCIPTGVYQTTQSKSRARAKSAD